MYLIDISLKNSTLSEEEQAKQLDAHRAWATTIATAVEEQSNATNEIARSIELPRVG